MLIEIIIEIFILICALSVIPIIVSTFEIDKKDKIIIVTTSILLILIGAFSTGVIMCILFNIIKFLLNLIMSVL